MYLKSVIVAIDQNNAIGKDNGMLCHLPNDLKHFKTTTDGHTVIMGRKTFESLPKGALPNRRNIVISRNKDLSFPNTEVFGSVADALATISSDETEVFFMGGGDLYKQVVDDADKLYITHIHASFDGADTFFPAINRLVWHVLKKQNYGVDEKNAFAHSVVVYERINYSHPLSDDE